MDRADDLPTPAAVLLGWKLHGRRVLVVGGGRVAEAKVEALADSGADIVVVAPAITARLADLHRQGALRWRPRRFRWSDPRGAALVVAAVDGRPTNQRVRRWAQRWRALVNVVDDPELCDVIVPAVVRRGPVRIAVGTDGTIPAGARFLREELDRLLPRDLGLLFEQAAAARHTLRHTGRYRYDYAAWRQRFFEPGMDALAGGHPGALGELARRLVATFDAPTPIQPGRVTLVGAGPGGADLVTVRGAAVLARADVVVYDRLVDPALLQLAPAAAERIPVGKAKGTGCSQHDINRVLVQRAQAGAHVVRLKGGDPFLFGRGGEEIDALEAAGVAVEVVPGLSSALAAPGLAQLPVTHRGLASSVHIVTGHLAEDNDLGWSALPCDGTVVALMGASTGAELARRLLATGRAPDEPVAALHRAGRTDAATATLTLQTLAERGCPFGSPTVLVIGAVAARARPDPDPEPAPTPSRRRAQPCTPPSTVNSWPVQ